MANLHKLSIPVPALTRASAKGSQYDFGSLTVGGDAIVDYDAADTKKAHSRMSSAVTAYRKRTGDKSKFTTRLIMVEGKPAIGVWKTSEAAAEVAAPAPVTTADTTVDPVADADLNAATTEVAVEAVVAEATVDAGEAVAEAGEAAADETGPREYSYN